MAHILLYYHTFSLDKMTKKKYDLKINYALFEVFRDYLEEHPELGFRSVSEHLNSVIREKAIQILNSKKDKKK